MNTRSIGNFIIQPFFFLIKKKKRSGAFYNSNTRQFKTNQNYKKGFLRGIVFGVLTLKIILLITKLYIILDLVFKDVKKKRYF